MAPVSVQRLEVAAACLRRGGYRSAEQYLIEIKRVHVKSGHPWSSEHSMVYKECVRAIKRGMGPDRQADALAIEEFASLPASTIKKFTRDYWPSAGVDAAIISCAWLLREVESSSAFLGSVQIDPRQQPDPLRMVLLDLAGIKDGPESVGEDAQPSVRVSGPPLPSGSHDEGDELFSQRPGQGWGRRRDDLAPLG